MIPCRYVLSAQVLTHFLPQKVQKKSCEILREIETIQQPMYPIESTTDILAHLVPACHHKQQKLDTRRCVGWQQNKLKNLN